MEQRPETDLRVPPALERVLLLACQAGPRTKYDADALLAVADMVNEHVPHATPKPGTLECPTCAVTRHVRAAVALMRDAWSGNAFDSAEGVIADGAATRD